MIVQLLALILLCSCVLFPSSGFAKDRKIALMVFYYGPNDLQPGSFNANARTFRERMSQMVAPLEAVSVRASNSSELRDALLALRLEASDEIVRLEITGHGSNGQVTEKTTTESGQVISDIKYQESHLAAESTISFRIPLNLDSKMSAEDVRTRIEAANSVAINAFAPIRGKFSEDAQIFCSACQFFPKSQPLAQATAMLIQKIFKIRSGTLYANVTDGQMFEGDFWREPFWRQESWKSKFVAGGYHLAALGTAAAVYYEPTLTIVGGIFSFAIAKAIQNARDRGYEIRFSSAQHPELKPMRAKEFLKGFFGRSITCESLFVTK